MNIGNIFRQTLGRQPSAEEADYFGGMLERGEIQPTEMLYFLQGTPEVKEQGLQQMAGWGQAQRAAQAYDVATFPQFRQQAMSQYAKMGRQSTSALDVAMAKEMSKLALQRGQQFAGMRQQDIAGNIAYGRETAATGRGQAWQGEQAQLAYQRQKELQDIQNQYNFMLAKQQRKWAQQDQPSFLESLVPSLIGAGASIYGAKLGKPSFTNYYMGGGW